MVRLKAKGLLFWTGGGTLFQFHYGTIKSVDSEKSIAGSKKFQFHYGTIKSCLAA